MSSRSIVVHVACQLTLATVIAASEPPAPTQSAAGIPVARAVSDPIAIGTRRELFVDDFLIESLRDARRTLHHPTPREIAIVHDAAWEGAGSGYHTLIPVDGLLRLYYRGSKLGVDKGQLLLGPEVYCLAESRDGGRTFIKPKLGLFEHEGSKDNNIVWSGVGTHNFSPFHDTRSDCPAESRFKALGGLASEGGLFAFHSADGIRWTLMRKEPVVTEGAFDSQNLAFWDPTAGLYRVYFRTFTGGITTGKVWQPEGFRAIRTATSADFLHWEHPTDLQYKDSPVEHLYTNQIAPYPRAPHLLLGFPTRYVERGWSDSMRALPQREQREQRAEAHLRYGTALTEGLIMASRDGVNFERWNEAFLRPGPERPATWIYGHQFIVWNMAETASDLPGAASEHSLYAAEGSWHGAGNAIRRYTLRLDGFVSVQAPLRGGELLSKVLTFAGNSLTLNFATSAAGDIRVEIQDSDGKSLPGFAIDDCEPMFGDTIQRTVTWKQGGDLGALTGRPVRLRFELRDADLYSLKFEKAH